MDRPDVPLLDLRHRHALLVLLEDAEVTPEMEQLVLDPAEHDRQCLVDAGRHGHADP